MPRLGILIGEDARVAQWAFKTYNFIPSKFDQAVGIVDEFGKLKGAALFQAHNGYNAEISYYGKRTLTPGIVRSLARLAVGLGLTRLTAVTCKKNKRFAHALEKLGFVRECTMRRYYGSEDNDRNAATRLVMYRERLDQIATTRGL